MIHPSLAEGRWRTFDIVEQLAHIGSEVSRAVRAKAAGDRARMDGAVERALELFDLTMEDPKNRGARLGEVCRAREVVCDFFWGDNAYHSTGESLDRYFLPYAGAARVRQGRA